jgi:formylglycine-generating enzyme required for sulfatase activity
MLAPLFDLAALAITVLTLPAAPALDPGPSPRCPKDMRLVAGTHYDEMEHLCVDPRRDTKDTHCFAYHEGLSAEEGKVTSVHVCMDQFEAPNIRGEKPFVMKSFKSATKWCAARKKRVCTEEEWEMACEGEEHRPLAYGWRVDATLCNSNKQWRPFDVKKLYGDGDDADKEVERLWQGSPSGAYQTCVSPFGIYDMMGNVEEWVTSRKSRKFPGALMGGFWAKPWTGCRGTNDAHEPTFTFYETGFRCCKDPG